MKKLDKNFYSLYYGDDLVGVGNLTELAKMAGVKRTYLRWLLYSAPRKRSLKRSIVKVEEDDDG